MRRTWLVVAIMGIVIAVLAAAWLDGGRRPLRTISEPVPVPELPK
jgi:hypothetical protein